MMGFISSPVAPVPSNTLSFYSPIVSGALAIDAKIHFCLHDLEPLNKTDSILLQITEKKNRASI